MLKDELFSIWAPEGLPWSAWVKPVLFSYMEQGVASPTPGTVDLDLSKVPMADGKTAIVVDLFNAQSVQAGLALAAHGYRPVPLFNTLPRCYETVPVLQSFSLQVVNQTPPVAVNFREIMSSMYFGAEILRTLPLSPTAPPAFLIHSNRRRGKKMSNAHWFDNRSMIFPTDLPSADYFRQRGITKVLLIQDKGIKPARDMVELLRPLGNAGLELQVLPLLPEGSGVSPLILREPSWWSRCWFTVVTSRRLRRERGGYYGHLVQSSG